MTKYFSFKGYSNRSEYWGVILLSTLVALLLVIVGALFLTINAMIPVGFVLLIVTGIGAAWIQLATIARRCRDIGINPWFTLTVYIPYVSIIIMIVFGCIASEKKEDGHY